MSCSWSFSIPIVALSLSFSPMMAKAEGTVLTGKFDGTERVMARDPSLYDCRDESAGFQSVSFEVSQSGEYRLWDPYDSHYYWQGWNAGYTLEIHEGPYPGSAASDPEPSTSGLYVLQSGRPYSLLVHSKCPRFEGAWAAAFLGPGPVLSDAAAELPLFSHGQFEPESPTMTSDCGRGLYAWGWGPVDDAPYAQVGPIRLSEGGAYYYGAEYASQACLAIYTAPVDPADRQANRLALLSGFDTTVNLEADTDYWLVSQWSGRTWYGNSRYVEYLHVLVPPAPFRINAGLNGAWYNPAAPGEGYFLSVFDSLNLAFLAQFTFSDHSVPGDRYGHRWYTAAGEFSGHSAELDLVLSTGGAFNANEPVPQQTQVGRMRLEFSDCTHGSILVDEDSVGSAPVSPAAIPLLRHGSDGEEMCRSQVAGLDEVGPL